MTERGYKERKKSEGRSFVALFKVRPVLRECDEPSAEEEEMLGG